MQHSYVNVVPGYHKDERQIAPLVYALVRHGFNILAYCQGHEGDGSIAPWIKIGLPPPRTQFIQDEGVVADIAKRYGIVETDVRAMQHGGAFLEFMRRTLGFEQTAEYVGWLSANRHALTKIKELLRAYHLTEPAATATRLRTSTSFDGGPFYLHAGWVDFVVPSAELEGPTDVHRREAAYRAEVERFTSFLEENRV
jgi:hypothetical protein